MTNSLEVMFAALGEARRVLILPHNDPDPDAIASAVALQYLLKEKWTVESDIGYRGIIGRAENRALACYLGQPLQQLRDPDLGLSTPIALVDTQPGAGNNALPPDIAPIIVIDHHPLCDATATAAYADIRPQMGSASTMLFEYLRATGLEPPVSVATALFYGIKTDTMGLGRGASPADVSAYLYLQTRIDVQALVEIAHAQVPADYFESLDTTLRTARIFNGVVISHIGRMPRPDLAAEMADLLMRLEGARWVICMGVYQSDLVLSVRTRSPNGDAGHLIREIVGAQGTAGGHPTMAAGHIPLRGRDPEQLAAHIQHTTLRHLDLDVTMLGRPLI